MERMQRKKRFIKGEKVKDRNIYKWGKGKGGKDYKREEDRGRKDV
jgi:hypothetical protein